MRLSYTFKFSLYKISLVKILSVPNQIMWINPRAVVWVPCAGLTKVKSCMCSVYIHQVKTLSTPNLIYLLIIVEPWKFERMWKIQNKNELLRGKFLFWFIKNWLQEENGKKLGLISVDFSSINISCGDSCLIEFEGANIPLKFNDPSFWKLFFVSYIINTEICK